MGITEEITEEIDFGVHLRRSPLDAPVITTRAAAEDRSDSLTEVSRRGAWGCSQRARRPRCSSIGECALRPEDFASPPASPRARSSPNPPGESAVDIKLSPILPVALADNLGEVRQLFEITQLRRPPSGGTCRRTIVRGESMGSRQMDDARRTGDVDCCARGIASVAEFPVGNSLASAESSPRPAAAFHRERRSTAAQRGPLHRSAGAGEATCRRPSR